MALAGRFYWHQNIATTINTTGMPLKLPPGFSISIYVSGLTGARVLKPDILPGSENLLVSLPSQGKVVVLKPDLDHDGKSDAVIDLVTGLNQPHGIEIANCSSTSEHPTYPCKLYIAETNQVSVFDYYSGDTPKVENKRKIIDLPSGSGHFTRSLLITPDFKRLLISVGSSCNICDESDWRRAKILSANLDGSDLKIYASGLRNAVFMAARSTANGRLLQDKIWATEMGRALLGDDSPPDEINIKTAATEKKIAFCGAARQPKMARLPQDEIWATEMGRDLLGDDLPPDEINILEEGKDYGWPHCYGQQAVDPFNQDRKDCSATAPSYINLQAHSAPLGIDFVQPWLAHAWPKDFIYDAFVAYHGSWNRSVPTGYKIVRFDLDQTGKVLKQEDFITGWLTDNNEALGRPVDIAISSGEMFVSDDKARVIYKVVYTGNQ